MARSTTQTPYDCNIEHKRIYIFRKIEWASGIGDDDITPMVLHETCNDEKKCPSLLRCPLRE